MRFGSGGGIFPPMEPIVVVTWRDAHFHHDEAVPDAYLVRTVGFLIAEEPEIQIAQEKLPDDDGHRAVSCIPPALVVEFDYLEIAPPAEPGRHATQAGWDDVAVPA